MRTMVVVGLIIGYIQQDWFLGMFITFSGGVIAMLVCIPPWPMYRQNPYAWKPPKDMIKK